MVTLSQKIYQLQQLISSTAKYYQRSPQEIVLLGASKGHTIHTIQEAYHAGIRNFGENYYQEALEKIKSLHALAISWHFIGHIQSNKTKGIATHFNWVHTVSKEEIAFLLNKYRSDYLPPLNICLQVNLDEEKSKSGVKPTQILELAASIIPFSKLKLRGLMAIPKLRQGEQQQYESFLRLKNLLLLLNEELELSLDTLSMGMSDDLIAAIRAGSTLLRIGRALFGER